jgi:excisionase family DNA binding protein
VSGLAISIRLDDDQLEAIAVRVAEILSAKQLEMHAPVGQALTVAEAAERLRVSSKTIYRAVESGRLPAHRVGRAVRIDIDWLAAIKTKKPARTAAAPLSRARGPGREFTTRARGRSLGA